MRERSDRTDSRDGETSPRRARGEIGRNRVKLHMQLSDGLPPVLADRVQLQQVIGKLWTTANTPCGTVFQFTLPAGGELSIAFAVLFKPILCAAPQRTLYTPNEEVSGWELHIESSCHM